MLKSTLTMLSVLGERMKARDPRRSPCGEGTDCSSHQQPTTSPRRAQAAAKALLEPSGWWLVGRRTKVKAEASQKNRIPPRARRTRKHSSSQGLGRCPSSPLGVPTGCPQFPREGNPQASVQT